MRCVGVVRDGRAVTELLRALGRECAPSRAAMREVIVAREDHACVMRLRRAVSAADHAEARAAALAAGAARRYAWWRAMAVAAGDHDVKAQWAAWEARTLAKNAPAWAAADRERALAARVDDEGGAARWLVSQETPLDVPQSCRCWRQPDDDVSARARAALGAVNLRIAHALGAAPSFWEGVLSGGWCNGDPQDGGRTAVRSPPATVVRRGSWIDMYEFRLPPCDRSGSGSGVVVRLQEELRDGDVVVGRSLTRPPMWVYVDADLPRKRGAGAAASAQRLTPDFERVVRRLSQWVRWVVAPSS